MFGMKGLAGLLAGTAVSLIGRVDAQTINVSTQLPYDLVRDNQYKMNVQVDSTQMPAEIEVGATNWKVKIPDYFSFVNATLPSSNDFFEGYTMDFNEIDTDGSDGRLSPNGRNTLGIHGPSQRIGDLENIYFTVNNDAPIGHVDNIQGQYSSFDPVPNFLLYQVNFSDKNGTLYNRDNGNLFLYNSPLYIHAKHGDADDDGDVDLSDLGILAGNYGMNSGATWSMGNFDNDGDTDLVDLGILAGNYGLGVQQAMADFQRIRADVPEPSILGLVAGLSYVGMHAFGRGRRARSNRSGLEDSIK